jgi:hypothetical protein
MSSISVISAGALLYDVLSNDAELSTMCTKVFPVIAEDAAILPYIDFMRVGVEVSSVKSREPMEGARAATYEVTCYASSYAQSIKMAERVCHILDNLTYQFTDAEDNKLTARSITFTGSEERWSGDAYAQVLTFTIRV